MQLTLSDVVTAVAEYRLPDDIRRHEVTNAQWALVRGVIPRPRSRRGLPRDRRQLLNGMLWILRAGAPWRDLPDRYGPWKTVWRNFDEWRQLGVLEQIKAALLQHLNEEGGLDWDLWCVDGTSVRAHRAAAGARKKGGPDDEPEDHALGRSRGGWGTKIHLVTDGQGVPLGAVLTRGQAHDSKSFEDALNAVRVPQVGVGRPRCRPNGLAADKAYSYRRIRHWLHHRKITPVIPQRSNQAGRIGGHRKFDKDAYRQRNVVERCVSWLKECRRVATRYEKLAVNFLGMVDLAIVQRLLRLLAP